MIYTQISIDKSSVSFIEKRILFDGLRTSACIATKDAIIDCNAYKGEAQQSCKQDVQTCLQDLSRTIPNIKNNTDSIYDNPEKDGIISFGLEDLMGGAEIKGAISFIGLVKVSRVGNSVKYVLKVIENGVSKLGTVSKDFYNTYLAKYLGKTEGFVKKMWKRPKALRKLKNQKEFRKARLEQLHYERYTVEGIAKRINREGLKIIKSSNPSFHGYQEYFLSGSNGVLRSVSIMQKNGAISMWFPKNIQGKGYTLALYVAVSRTFKLPIIMSKNLTKTVFSKDGAVLKRGGDYIWEELKKQDEYI